MFKRRVGLGLAVLLLLGIGHRTIAQIPDTTAISDSLAVPDSLVVPDTLAVADTIRTTPADSLTSPTRSPWGVPITPIPAFTETLAPGEVFGFSRVRGVIAYPLNTPGRWVGVHLENMPLALTDLTLDGLPFYDVITGGSALSLVPAEVSDQFYQAGAETGSALGLSTATRPLRSAHPITELRFLTGGSGAQAVSATHAQTRKAPGFLGGADGRVTGTFHVANRRGEGTLDQPLRHTDLVARLGLLRQSLGIETQFQYTERSETISLAEIPVLIPRGTLRTDLRFSIATPIVGKRPTRLAARWTRQSLRLADIDTVAAHQATVRLEQPAGPRRMLSSWVVLDGAYEGDSLAAPARASFGLSISDTLRFSGNRLSAVLGGANRDGSWRPVLLGRFERGTFFAEASYGSSMPSRPTDSLHATAEQNGAGSVAQVARGAVGGSLDWKHLRLAVGASISRRDNVEARLYGPDSIFQFVHLDEPLTMAGATAEIGLRDRRERGVYTSAMGAFAQPVGVDGELATRVAEAIPGFRGALRVGYRAIREETPRIALDLSATLSGWTPFTTQVVDPVTGEAAVHVREASGLPRTIARNGMVDLLAEATISNRAHLFLGLNHALGSINSVLFLGEQWLPVRQVRFGISWVLTD